MICDFQSYIKRYAVSIPRHVVISCAMPKRPTRKAAALASVIAGGQQSAQPPAPRTSRGRKPRIMFIERKAGALTGPARIGRVTFNRTGRTIFYHDQRVGLGATSYDTTDSVGRPMGFNDPLHAEHYVIMLRNFSPTDLLQLEYGYAWILFFAHVVGAGMLLSSRRVSARVCRWFFLAQAAVFPIGFLAMPFFPLIVAGFFTGRMDREGFVDIPFIVAVAHPVWVVVSLVICFGIRGSGLGLSGVWSALAQATRAGARTFARAIR